MWQCCISRPSRRRVEARWKGAENGVGSLIEESAVPLWEAPFEILYHGTSDISTAISFEK